MKKIFSIGLCLAAFCYSSNTFASENFDYTAYVGLDYAFSDAKAKGVEPGYNLLNFNVGTKYNNFFGTEAFFEQSSTDTKKFNASDKLKTSYRAYGIDVFGYLPLGCYHTFDLLGTVGLGEYVFKEKINNEKHNSEHAWGYRAGVGIVYNIDENVSMRAVARYVGLNDITKIDHLYEYSVGLRYHFY